MIVSRLTQAEGAVLAIVSLGLNPDSVSLTSMEALAASLRRAASFMCPTSPSRLIDAVVTAVKPLAGEDEITREMLADLVDRMVDTGDLLELRRAGERATRLLYLGPPSYVEKSVGTYLVVGVRPYGAPLVDFDLSGLIEYEGHTRTIYLDGSTAHDQLYDAGLHRIERNRWVGVPASEGPEAHLGRFTSRLEAAPSSGAIEGLQVIDPNAGVGYYRGRWRKPGAEDSGDFVARRPQAYGADLWCVVRLSGGAAMKLIDLPIDPAVPGRDEAWRLQMAMDATNGKPQRCAILTAAKSNAVVAKFFSPLPGFAERYLQTVGLSVESTRCLFAYRIPDAAIAGVEELITKSLWMETSAVEGTP